MSLIFNTLYQFFMGIHGVSGLGIPENHGSFLGEKVSVSFTQILKSVEEKNYKAVRT